MAFPPRDRRTELEKLLEELNYLYTQGLNALTAKKNELLSIEYSLQRLGYPGITAGVVLGSLFLGRAGERTRLEIQNMLQRRQELYAEIARERRYLTELAQKISTVSNELLTEKQRELEERVQRARVAQALRYATPEQVTHAERERIRQEIEHLLDELRITTDERAREFIIRRLRQLGYRI